MVWPLIIPAAIAAGAVIKGASDAATKHKTPSKAPKGPYGDAYPAAPMNARPEGTTDVDFSTAGAGERQWKETAAAWKQPTNVGNYWNGVQGRMAQPPQYGLEAYTEAKRMAAPDTSGYYDRAESKMMNSINRNAAATGMLGSKYNQDALNRGILDLRAEEANRAGQRCCTLSSACRLSTTSSSATLMWIVPAPARLSRPCGPAG